MATYTFDKIDYGGNTYVVQDSGALQLTGGTVTGPVTFGDSITVDEATLGDLVVNGNASFTNNIQANTINGVAVGSSPKFTDTVTTVTTSGSGNAITAISASNGAITATKGTTFLTSHNTYTVSTTGSGNAVTAVSLSGTTFTVTKGATYSNNAGTITGVTAGTGLSGGGTSGSVTLNHSNSVTAQTTQAVYPIKIDAQGHISAYGSAVTIPSIPSNNLTGSGTSGYLAKWNGTYTLTNGPQLGSSTTTYLRNDGSWATPPGSYSLPLAASGTRGGIQIGFTTNETNRNYAVALSSEKAYVNVPSDIFRINFTWSASTGNCVSNKTFSELVSAYNANKTINATYIEDDVVHYSLDYTLGYLNNAIDSFSFYYAATSGYRLRIFFNSSECSLEDDIKKNSVKVEATTNSTTYYPPLSYSINDSAATLYTNSGLSYYQYYNTAGGYRRLNLGNTVAYNTAGGAYGCLRLYGTGATYYGDLNPGTIGTNSLTANRTWTLPNATGTIALTSDLANYVSTSDVSTTGGANKIVKSDSSGNITITGYISTSSGVVGEIKKDEPSAVSTTSGKYYKIAEVKLDPGIWVYTTTAEFAANTSGYRRAYTTTDSFSNGTSTAPTVIAKSLVTNVAQAGGQITHTHDAMIFAVTSATTYRLVSYQNSGSTLSVTGRIYAVRIA